jgi:hypothetical protein
MEKLFVPYLLALKLKEKGFGLAIGGRSVEPCLGGYSNLQELHIRRVDFQSDLDGFCLAPNYQQVVDWLREKHDIVIYVKYFSNKFCGILASISKKQNVVLDAEKSDYYQSFNKAIEEALKLI